jgi:hypothetical protein
MEADALIIRAARDSPSRNDKDLDREMSIARSKKVKLDPQGGNQNLTAEPSQPRSKLALAHLVPILQLRGNKQRCVD